MFQELKFQLSTAILTVITLAAAVGAFFNFEAQYHFRLPDDGVIWVDRAPGVEALHVTARGPGANAGVHQGDVLESIQGIGIAHSTDVARHLAGIQAWHFADYRLSRGGIEFNARVMVGEVPLDRVVVWQYAVGVAFLLIGLFVYFRRGSAFKAQHFYIYCLTSFIFFCSHYTGQLTPFDKTIYYANIAAGLLSGALFLHLTVTFPERLRWFPNQTRVALLYLPGAITFAAYLAFSTGALRIAMPLQELSWFLDRVWLALVIASLCRRGGGAHSGAPQSGRPGRRASRSSGCATAWSAESCRSACCTACRMRWARCRTIT